MSERHYNYYMFNVQASFPEERLKRAWDQGEQCATSCTHLRENGIIIDKLSHAFL